MIIKLLIATILLIEFAAGSLWMRCQQLTDKFHFSSLDAQLKLQEAISNDVGYATHTARFFHNKVNVYGTELINKYLQFWDIHFDALFFSVIGLFGIFCGFWYLLVNKKRTYKTWLIILVLLILPFIEIGHIVVPYWIRICIILIPYYLFSLFGTWQFLKHHKSLGSVIVSILIVLSLWYLLVFQKEIFNHFCYN